MIKLQTSRKAFFNFQHTALTDVVFLLMIFFLLTSTFVTSSAPAFKAAGAAAAPARIARLKILGEKIFLNDRAITRSQLAPALMNLKSSPGELQLVFEAAGSTPLGVFSDYLEIAGQSGLQKFSFSLLK